jgi:stage II sporulation protein D
MRYRSLIIAFLLVSAGLFAQPRSMEVGLFRSHAPREVHVAARSASATILVDGKTVGDLGIKDGLRVEHTADGLHVRTLARSWTGRRSVTIRPGKPGYLHLTAGRPAQHRDLDGEVTFTRTGASMVTSTELPLDAYVAGVVQAESGNNKALEYYKLQAVICRTYALTNQRKHLPDGFNVCDGTHCQVFKGRVTIPTILEAVGTTEDMVVVDAAIRLIHATFHSNCGGETMNAEDVWSRSEPYLVSALDTFCMRSTHATWERTLARADWIAYLHRSFGLDPHDTLSVERVTSFAPPCRSLYFDGARPLIPLARVRQDMKFNSAYFHVRTDGDKVVFQGRGFGHGVGLCQEGAMRMAELGIPFTEILHHYFAEVHLVDLNSLAFFRDEGP